MVKVASILLLSRLLSNVCFRLSREKQSIFTSIASFFVCGGHVVSTNSKNTPKILSIVHVQYRIQCKQEETDVRAFLYGFSAFVRWDIGMLYVM